MRRLVAPIFVLLVLGFVAFAGLVIVSFAARLAATWHLWALAGWLGVCAALVVGGTLAEQRRRARAR